MRLAADDIVIAITGYSPVILHPSLRAALRIARRYNGFAKPLESVAAGNLTVMIDLLREAGAERLADLFAEIGTFPLGLTMSEIAEPLTSFMLALAGIDPEAPPTVTAPDDTRSPAEVFETLFERATGWLGWSAGEAWNATPAEIDAALGGRIELLKWLFGGSDDDKPAKPQAPHSNPLDPAFDPNARDPNFDRAGWNELRADIMQGNL